MFGTRLAEPESRCWRRVSHVSEIDLGAYPEDLLAVTGAYPTPGALDYDPDSIPAFCRLDGQARMSAMQTAYGRLVSDGTPEPALPAQA